MVLVLAFWCSLSRSSRSDFRLLHTLTHCVYNCTTWLAWIPLGLQLPLDEVQVVLLVGVGKQEGMPGAVTSNMFTTSKILINFTIFTILINFNMFFFIKQEHFPWSPTNQVVAFRKACLLSQANNVLGGLSWNLCYCYPGLWKSMTNSSYLLDLLRQITGLHLDSNHFDSLWVGGQSALTSRLDVNDANDFCKLIQRISKYSQEGFVKLLHKTYFCIKSAQCTFLQ